jgi:splicing factor 1
MRQKLVRRALEIKPDFVPPIDFKPTGLMHQVFIPHKKYPHVNFQGLIIGPRGANQKRMELETGCTIQIRGQGAGREGKAPGPTDDDELHVLIQGPTQEQIDKATKMVEFLVQDPNNKALVEYKAKQLRQLARMNGTLVEGNVCSICSEPGHHPWECPERTGAAWKPADVFCDVCGGEHLTDDCPLTLRFFFLCISFLCCICVLFVFVFVYFKF